MISYDFLGFPMETSDTYSGTFMEDESLYIKRKVDKFSIKQSLTTKALFTNNSFVGVLATRSTTYINGAQEGVLRMDKGARPSAWVFDLIAAASKAEAMDVDLTQVAS